MSRAAPAARSLPRASRFNGNVGNSKNTTPITGVNAGTVNGDVTISIEGQVQLYGALTGAATGATVNGNVSILFNGKGINKGYTYLCNGATVNGDVSLTVMGGKMERGIEGAHAGSVTNSTIHILGGTIGSGTHHNRGVGGGTVIGLASFVIDGGLINTRIYGVQSGLAGSSNVTINGGTIVAGGSASCEVFGLGGGTVTGNASTAITGGSIDGNVHGVGGGSVGGSVITTISGGAITGNVYGVGTTGKVTGDASTVISGGAIGGAVYVIGGSNPAVSGGAFLTVIDGLIAGDIITVTTAHEGDAAVFLEGGTFTGSIDGAASLVGGESLLDIDAAIATTGSVANFSRVLIEAGASLTASAITAPVITVVSAETAGSYMLATGFAAQDSTITVVNANGGQLGSVTLSASATSGSFTAGDFTYTVSVNSNALTLDIAGSGPVPPTPTATVAEVILTITDPNHDYFGATGGWKVQNDQTVAWQDLTTLGAGYSYLGLGATAANKAMPDIYVYNADAKYVAAYTTDATGAITGFESIFSGEAALMQVGLADFNADGVSDLLLRTADGFVGYYANGAFAEVQGLGTEWTVAALGDLDGNGRADVIIAHEAGYVGAYLVGTDDVIVQVGANYFGAWLCSQGAVTGFFGIGEFAGAVQDIADYNADGKDDLLFRTSGGVVGAALITGADATTWAEYGALGAEWSTKGVGIL